SGIRLVWEYAIETAASSADASADFSVELYVSGTVTLVTVDVHSRKIVRRQPPAIQKLMTKS
ncbi:MAG: hypothetical protein AAFY54_21450, partial [Cyanobacteria bacterium J06648_10]